MSAWERADENPYWTACRLVLGRRPMAVEFIAWIGRQWRALDEANGVRWPRSLVSTVGPERAHVLMMAHLDALLGGAL